MHAIDHRRVRARRRLLASLWKIALASVLLGALVALTAAGGGFGGPLDAMPADTHKATAVVVATVALAALMSLGALVRYWLDVHRAPKRAIGGDQRRADQ